MFLDFLELVDLLIELFLEQVAFDDVLLVFVLKIEEFVLESVELVAEDCALPSFGLNDFVLFHFFAL